MTIANHLGAVIEGEGADPREGILSHKEGIDLMPANIELAGMEMPILMAMSREQLMNVWVSLLKGDYDFILFDCAPTLGIIPVNAFVASDSVLIPVSVEYLPASAMVGLLNTIGRVRRQINPTLSVEGILLTLFDSRNNLAHEVEQTIRDQYGSAYRVFDTVIPRAVSAAEAPSVGVSIFACIVRVMTDEEATIAMVDSNLQRETILPSERAFAYSMRLEAMKHQGWRTDLTSAQLAQKPDGRWSRDILAEELGVSKDKVQRFIRLTFGVSTLS